MYRKIAIICIIVFMAQVSTQVQALTVTLMLFFSIFLQYRTSPYNSSELNVMELEALITATLTIYCGLYYATNDLGEVFKINLFLLIVFGNAFFLVTWIFWTGRAFIDALAKFVPFLKYFLKKGDAFSEEFYGEKLKVQGSYYSQLDAARFYTFLNGEEDEYRFFKISSMDELYLKTFKKSLKDPLEGKEKFKEKYEVDEVIERENLKLGGNLRKIYMSLKGI
jgi:hypothetical protein